MLHRHLCEPAPSDLTKYAMSVAQAGREMGPKLKSDGVDCARQSLAGLSSLYDGYLLGSGQRGRVVTPRQNSSANGWSKYAHR